MSDRAVHALSEADRCRENGWKVGDVLEGDEGYGPTCIQLTAIGESLVLAKSISHGGVASNGREGPWTLAYRDWKKVAPPLAGTDKREP